MVHFRGSSKHKEGAGGEGEDAGGRGVSAVGARKREMPCVQRGMERNGEGWWLCGYSTALYNIMQIYKYNWKIKITIISNKTKRKKGVMNNYKGTQKEEKEKRWEAIYTCALQQQ